ncbi:MAG: hypothetical protein K2N48_04500 [Muribaculaceae bacterium]|nr:hypothetical protein [Muribaculaceae bacterium]
MENRYLNDDDLKYLERIDPFPGIEEALTDIINNNNYKGQRVPYLEFNDALAAEYIPNEEEMTRMPKLCINILDQNESLFDVIFEIEIDLWESELSRHGKSTLDCLMFSRFADLFVDQGYAKSVAIVAMDVRAAARFMTYYLEVFGYKDISELNIRKYMSFTSGDMSKLYLPDEITVPVALGKAVAKLKELKFSYDDAVLLFVSGLSDSMAERAKRMGLFVDSTDESFYMSFEEYWKDRDEIDRRRSYRNFDCLYLSVGRNGYCEYFYIDDSETDLRFLTDYFLFLNPDVDKDEIVVSLDFSSCKDYESEEDSHDENEDLTDWLFSFYPDSSEDDTAKLSRLLEELGKMRAYYNEKFEKVESERIHGLSTDGEDLDYKAFRETEPSSVICQVYKDLDWYQIGQEVKKTCLYDEDGRLVMEISRQDLSDCYYFEPVVKAVCTLYLNREQKDEFYKLYSDPRLETYEYDVEEDSEPPVTICLLDDVGLVSKYVAYCLISVGYDPKRLSCELDFVKCDNSGR